MPSLHLKSELALYGLLNLLCAHDDNQQLEEIPVTQCIATQFVNNNTYILEEREDTRSTPRKDEGLFRGTPRLLQFMQGQSFCG